MVAALAGDAAPGGDGRGVTVDLNATIMIGTEHALLPRALIQQHARGWDAIATQMEAAIAQARAQ